MKVTVRLGRAGRRLVAEVIPQVLCFGSRGAPRLWDVSPHPPSPRGQRRVPLHTAKNPFLGSSHCARAVALPWQRVTSPVSLAGFAEMFDSAAVPQRAPPDLLEAKRGLR